MNDYKQARFKRAFLGGLVLFTLAFPLINILMTDIYIALAEGSWRPPFRELAGTTAVACYLVTVIPWLFLLWSYRRWAVRHGVFNVRFGASRRAVVVSGVLVALALTGRVVLHQESSLATIFYLHARLWGLNLGLLVTVELYVYYFFEGVLMAWMVAMLYGLIVGVVYLLGRKNNWPPVVAWLVNYL